MLKLIRFLEIQANLHFGIPFTPWERGILFKQRERVSTNRCNEVGD